jgi:hypothetical protein
MIKDTAVLFLLLLWSRQFRVPARTRGSDLLGGDQCLLRVAAQVYWPSSNTIEDLDPEEPLPEIPPAMLTLSDQESRVAAGFS